MTQYSLKSLISFAALLFLVGCVTPIPEGSVSDFGVDQVIATPPEEPQPIRWGGTIATVQNLEDGRTTVEIVSRPLATNGRPVHNDQTDGRFIAEINEILDPAIIKAGRDITVVGLVAEVLRDGTIGQTPYTFPVVNVDDYHFWNPSKQYGRRPCYGCEYGFGFYSDDHAFFGFDSGFHFGYHGHHGHRRGFGWPRGFPGHHRNRDRFRALPQ